MLDINEILFAFEKEAIRKFDKKIKAAEFEVTSAHREKEAYLDGAYDFCKILQREMKGEDNG
jgi:hypothetical protein